jgi:hypothetical protein
MGISFGEVDVRSGKPAKQDHPEAQQLSGI